MLPRLYPRFKLEYRAVRWRFAFPMLLVGLGVIGCSEAKPPVDLPKTYSVEGKVKLKNGEPLTEGVVQFQSLADQSVTATGTLQPDGGFSISSYFDGEKVPGTIPGAHQVTIIRPSPDQLTPPTVLPKTYDVKPTDNFFTFTLEK